MIKKDNIENVNREAGPNAAVVSASRAGLLQNMSQYRSLESLPRRAWEYIDDILIRTAKEELNGVADLNSRPQTNVTFDGMTATTYNRERVSEVGAAHVAISPDTQSQSSMLDMDTTGVPLMVTYKDFHINIKQMAEASRIGLPLQSALVEEATRSVSRKLEDLLFNADLAAAGSHLYGYTTFPDRQTYTITDWSNPATTPNTILKEINDMITLSMQANHFGPWILYIPWQYQSRMNEDYTVGAVPVSSNRSIRDRLTELPRLEDIKVAQYLANHNVVLVEMTASTIQMINAMPMRAVQWEAPGSPNWEKKFKVLTMAVPFIVSDYKGQCGVIHGSV